MPIKFNPGCPCCKNFCKSPGCDITNYYNKVRMTYTVTGNGLLNPSIVVPPFVGPTACSSVNLSTRVVDATLSPRFSSIPPSGYTGSDFTLYEHTDLPGYSDPSNFTYTDTIDGTLTSVFDSTYFCNTATYNITSSKPFTLPTAFVKFDCAATAYANFPGYTRHTLPNGSVYAFCQGGYTFHDLDYTLIANATFNPVLGSALIGISLSRTNPSINNQFTNSDPLGFPCNVENIYKEYFFSFGSDGPGITYFWNCPDWYITFDITSTNGDRITGSVIGLP